MTTSPPPPSSDRPPGPRLNGWKEIASYLGRGVRTVQRWEKTLGLPVRRLESGKAETVHAIPAELDAWFAVNAGRREVTDHSYDIPPDGGGPPAASAAEPGNGDDPSPEPRSSTAHDGLPAFPWPWWTIGAALVVVSLLAAFAVGRGRTVPQPATIRIDHDVLRAYDGDGALIWTRTFTIPLVPPGYDDAQAAAVGRTVVDDIDGDGQREVVVFTPSTSTNVHDRLLAIDARGRDLWTRVADGMVRFGDTDYPPPWVGHRMHVVQVGHERQLWVVWVHHASGNFPCVVERLSSSGQPVARYWSAGYVESITAAVVGGVPSILLGAANNDHQGASLAVFDADKVRGSAPADTADKTCRNCPPGGPRAFLVFPRMELLQRALGFPGVTEVRQAASGELRATVSQAAPDRDGRLLSGNVYYMLSPDLTPVSAEVGAEYIASHDELHRAGQLDHPFGAADLASGWPVLVWKDGRFVPVTGTSKR